MLEAAQPTSIEHRLKDTDQLCFVRIPKTGSTTLISILDAKFDVDAICPILAGNLPETPAETLANYKLFRGHFDYDLCSHLPKNRVHITMLRHPIDRAISFYEFCKRCQTPRPFDQYLRQEAHKGIQAFIDHPDPTIRLRTANCQTRYIAAGLGSRHSRPMLPSPLETQYSDQELLAIAKEHLRQFAFVGITERFQDSVLLLSYIFGWQPITEYQNLRVSAKKPKRDELAPETIAAIINANQLDMELYDYAQQLFAERFAQMLKNLAEKYGRSGDREVDLRNLKSFNTASPDQQQQLLNYLEIHYQHRYTELNLRPVSRLDFDFLQAISGVGWHRRNGIHSGLRVESTPFRWTGPSTESTLDFPLATSADLTIRVRVVNAATPEILNSLELLVNDHLIPLKTFLHRENIVVLQGLIPQAALESDRGFSRLTFRVSETVSLQNVNPEGTDTRIVGVAIHRIQLFPVSAPPDAKSSKPFLFPEDDESWQQAIGFLEQQLKPTERIAAPIEFVEKYPEQFCAYTQSFRRQAGLAWVVVHKGSIAEVDDASLDWITRKFKPVFANEVFVIFSNRRDCPKISIRLIHLRAFWRSWLELKLQKAKDRYPFLSLLFRS
ncbi:MAG: hypothetical protein Kow00121_55550 [Elainellaceae cyanobacterium]